MIGAPAVVGALVAIGFAIAAAEDARTSRVTIRTSQAITAVAVVGLGAYGLATARWGELAQAAIGAALVTGIQAVPYLLQQRRRRHHPETAWIGKADLRLATPLGWTLGWFGVGFAVVGYGAALLVGIAAVLVMRRRQIPFVPCLAAGLWLGLGWAALIS